MADKVVDYSRTIKNASGQIGSMQIHVEDGVVTGLKLSIQPVWLQQADIATIQAVYTELKNWATANNYTWTAA